jgi:hypothetical protein
MKRIVILSILLIIFTGSGKVYYSSIGRTAGEFEIDKARCMNFANGAYGSQLPYPSDTGNNKYNIQVMGHIIVEQQYKSQHINKRLIILVIQWET